MNLFRTPKLYLYSPVLLAILLIRPSLDSIASKFKIAGFSFGAVFNLFILVCLLTILLKLKFKIYREAVWWLPLLFLMIISLAWTPNLTAGIRLSLVAVTYAAMFTIPFHFIKTESDFVECIKAIIISAIIPILFTLYEVVFPAGSTNHHGFRLFGSFSHPNVFAFFLLTIFATCFYAIKSSLFIKEVTLRKFCMLFIFIVGVCILGTKTRSAWLIVFFIILLFGLFSEKRFLIYLAIASLIALSVPSVQERLIDLTKGNDIDAFVDDYQALNSYAWRKVIWAGALDKFWEAPILGFGYQSFMNYSHDFFLIPLPSGAAAHNTYVQLLFELGVLGIIAFFYLLFSVMTKLWLLVKLERHNIIIFGLFVGYMLSHFSDNILGYLVFNWYFWFLIGAIIAQSKINKTKAPIHSIGKHEFS
ncbi:O-antigen ligase [Glaciecola sp. KUL10]|uniref:O-antigen ligase family protein n=1 Tax=Glaciecola sp. (strain KUL10) TaxID=2161813 RepID=UPI000D78362B|nr:O-antigen ligase family protein [Glaciecola sp. KUL10]GBL04854.1 O-antigen polymerase [Glaciecola sp. KUL10]